MNKFYITTAIDYVNGPPHIGHALEKVQADVLARWHRKFGDDVFFLIGTDEHGTKLVRSAKEENKSPEEFVEENAVLFKKMNNCLNISFDNFIRTSDKKNHWPAAQKIWQLLEKNGDIYKGNYKGFYCVGCEAYIQEDDLDNGKCLVHGKEAEFIEEENYFFRLSKYEKEIKKLIEDGKFEIFPETKQREVLGLINQGLKDISFSRPRKVLSWGVPVPGDDAQTMYVWCDALTNYLSGIGYPKERYKKYWPTDVHCIGKDILRFHALLWPAMLLSAGLDLPKKIFVHGYLTIEGEKISKSLGNTVDVLKLVDQYGVDAVRYFLLREIPSSADGDFSRQKFIERYNADLAGGIGNLVARVLSLAEKKGSFPKSAIKCEGAHKIVHENYREAIEDFQFHIALDAIWGLIHNCDRIIEREKPWDLAKQGDDSQWRDVMSYLICSLYTIADFLEPFLPQTASKIKEQLDEEKRGESLFPRIDL